MERNGAVPPFSAAENTFAEATVSAMVDDERKIMFVVNQVYDWLIECGYKPAARPDFAAFMESGINAHFPNEYFIRDGSSDFRAYCYYRRAEDSAWRGTIHVRIPTDAFVCRMIADWCNFRSAVKNGRIVQPVLPGAVVAE